jgi:TRAP-type C4-dicarboxylate transport system permease large subunit
MNGWGHLIKLQINRVIKTAFGAWLGFFAIGLVLWGIYTGKFSPTEAAAVTVGFCVIVGLVCLPLFRILKFQADTPVENKTYAEMVVVKGFKFTDLPSIVIRSAQITGILAPLIAISVVMQQILSLLGAKETIEAFVTGMGGYYAVLFTAMIIVFFSGMVLESLPVTIILAPILAPIAHSIGVDPVHFAVIFLVGASIGFITPPYGLNLYVASGVTGVPYMRLLRYTVPYLVALLSVWLLVALVPELSTMLLPNRG